MTTALLTAIARTVRTELSYTYGSARRDGWSRRYAARKCGRELRRGLRPVELRCYAAEIRAARRQGAS